MIWTDEEQKTVPPGYNCELLVHNATEEQIKNTNLPTDTYLINYTSKDGPMTDLCRSTKMSNIFDLYYDKIGNNIHKIDFGYGKISPKLWGMPPPEKKKRKR